MLDRGLVDDGPRFLFPTEFTVEMRHAEVKGELGRNFVRNGDDEWIYGPKARRSTARGGPPTSSASKRRRP